MQSLMKVICIGYLVFLTLLLLTKDPFRLIGVQGDAPGVLRMLLPVAHLLSFLTLAVLALVARWPAPRWGVTVFLVLYAGMTEVVQSFLPPRTAEWNDWFQDLVGIAVGAALCWIVALAAGTRMRLGQKSKKCAPPGTLDEWEIVRNVMSRPTTRGQSWWG